MSQTGMIRHWNRLLKEETDPKVWSKMFRARIINAVGAAMSITVLLVVLVTKFQAGAKYAILAMAVLYVMMLAINRHYRHVSQELALRDDLREAILPSRVHARVLVSAVQAGHGPSLCAQARPVPGCLRRSPSKSTRRRLRRWVASGSLVTSR